MRNGKYHAAITYTDSNGKSHSTTKSLKLHAKGNKKKANEMCQQIKKQKEAELKLLYSETNWYEFVDRDTLTFTAFLRKWVDSIEFSMIGKEPTYASYRTCVLNKIIPYFDKKHQGLLLKDVTPMMLEEFYNWEIKEQGLSISTIYHRHAYISKALSYAVKNNFIIVNPARSVELPDKPKTKMKFYTLEEIKTLLEIVKDTELELAVILGCIYGLRRSEIVGLKWDAFDFEKKTITINHTVVSAYIDGKTQLIEQDKTKTKSSLRTLPILKPLELVLEKYKTQKEKGKELYRNSYNMAYDDYVYVNEFGERIKPDKISRDFPKLLLDNNLKRIRLDDLRHSCASLLYEEGVPMKKIQNWLGHSVLSTTMDLYTHLYKDADQQCTKAFDDVLEIYN